MSYGLAGFRPWLIQRISAIYVGLVSLLLGAKFLFYTPINYQDWMGFLGQPVVFLGLSLFGLALLMHAWVGMRDVVLDYVHSTFVRVSLLSLLGLGLITAALWMIFSMAAVV